MDFHIFTTHRHGRGDESPLQLISVELLVHYRHIEDEYLRMQKDQLRRRRGSDNTLMTSPNASWPAT